MPKSVAKGPLGKSGPDDSIFNGLLHQRVVYMMPSLLLGSGISPSFLLGKNPLPSPFSRGIRILSFQHTGQLDTTPARSEVFSWIVLNGSGGHAGPPAVDQGVWGGDEPAVGVVRGQMPAADVSLPWRCLTMAFPIHSSLFLPAW